MRELKFRAWESGKRAGMWIFRGGHSGQKRYCDDVLNLREACGRVDIIEQYTGCKDRNGKEIYEGDIVRCVNNHIGVVEFEENDSCFNVSNYYSQSDDYPTMAFFEGSPFEIIGNIHEDPDLLGEDK